MCQWWLPRSHEQLPDSYFKAGLQLSVVIKVSAFAVHVVHFRGAWKDGGQEDSVTEFSKLLLMAPESFLPLFILKDVPTTGQLVKMELHISFSCGCWDTSQHSKE